ncbi:MAG TPA: glucosamine-6-phosphate deaminase [Pedobacter sp.]|uniref:glucosamine-6-phosphate deaminase n=1 Tax=Pedobacter sp. TaxID=1411316 RepID=UPI002C7FB961|nr:glucosamine-6-phosphate deaminase [Pedobacter sp.]HMI05226.1 glucosamine-6-phosphate deaminase [Pedobacter sp.]
MNIFIENDPKKLGEAAGKNAAHLIKQVISEKGQANIILATGTSQFETLKQLIDDKEIDWSKVVMFHLDEYIGLPETEPASFRKYLKERFLNNVAPLQAVHLVDGEASDPQEECERLGKIIAENPIDIALVGIGENGHLAFNDPPADFNTEKAYLVVDLEAGCRMQQFAEGWFKSIDEVPKKAISMSVKQIMSSKHIICSVPDSRKAEAVKNSIEQPISNLYPASILQAHTNCTYYFDKASAHFLQVEP